MSINILRSAGKNVRLAVGAAVLVVFVLIALFAEFIAPYDHRTQSRLKPQAPITRIHLFGGESIRPYFYPQELSDPLTYGYRLNTAEPRELVFFTRGDKYSFWGLIETDIHLFGASMDDPEQLVHLLGTDSLGRDRFSRLLLAVRFSLIVSLLGTVLACLLGISVGIISGYAGRNVDTILMGSADAMMSLPTLILILAARAAFPLELPAMTAAILLITIFALTGWAEMARLTQGLVRAMREREFVLAAKATGLSESRILLRHILPNISGPLLTQATLILPAFLLAEAALSFLGVGVQEPAPSLGNMLAAANDVTLLSIRPVELLSPAAAIFLLVLGVRLFSDGRKAEKF